MAIIMKMLAKPETMNEKKFVPFLRKPDGKIDFVSFMLLTSLIEDPCGSKNGGLVPLSLILPVEVLIQYFHYLYYMTRTICVII